MRAADPEFVNKEDGRIALRQRGFSINAIHPELTFVLSSIWAECGHVQCRAPHTH